MVTPDGERAHCVVVCDGIISSLDPHDAPPDGARVIELGHAALLPGVVDTHVHLNDPGRTEWEGFGSGTRAAAAGGVTTIVDMPLNSVPATTTLHALQLKREAAEGQCHVDVGFWGGVVPGNVTDIAKLWDAGVLGFKCFLAPSGVTEFEHVDAMELRRVLPLLAELGAPLLVHAELPGDLKQAVSGADVRAYSTYLATRPDAAEVQAARLLIEMCRETHAHIHFVHVSSQHVLPFLRAARAEGLPITAETCPHYLHFEAESIPEGGTQWKCAPPIRSASNREALWRALASRDLDLIASDHSPAPPAMKRPWNGSFLEAWGGIASLQLGLPVIWTDARERGIELHSVAHWMSAAPALLAGLPQKGAIEAGRDADFVVFDTESEWTVNASALHHRHPLSPYDGERLTGIVRATFVRGTQVYDADNGHAEPTGRLLDNTTNGIAWTSRI